jgi:hypothetical protein
MQKKTIASVLHRKVDQWLATIKDEAVRKLARENVIVTGGSIVSMLQQEPVNDYDVYFRTGEAAYAVADYYVGQFKESGKAKVELFLANEQGHQLKKFDGKRFTILAKSSGAVSESEELPGSYQYFEATDPDGVKSQEYLDQLVDTAVEKKKQDGDYRPVFMSSNAITLSDKIQLVIRFWGEPDEIHKNYDFVHCTSYWTSWDGQIVLRPEALESILSKTLIYSGSLYPICSVIRTRKFVQRGWRITAGQYLKMCMQLSKLDLNDIKVLREQLTGVDSAYFAELLGLLEKDMKDKSSKTIDGAYLSQLIEKLF